MLTKILMCSCNVEQFHREQKYVRKLCHFHCHCNDSHFLYVYTCKDNSFVTSRIPEMDLCCTCEMCEPNEICNFCEQVRYLLNFKGYKLCVKKIPESMQQHLLPLDKYFKSMPVFQSFFLIWVMPGVLIFH